MRIAITGGLLAATLLGGCTTHLESAKVDPSKPQSRQGIAYFLPFTQFTVTTTWVVGTCGETGPEFAVTVDAEPGSAPDPYGMQVIDYQSLSAWTKTSSVKVDFYDSGAIKSINASADDKTGEIIGSVASMVGKIGAFAAVGHGAALSSTCSDELNEALGKVPDLKGKIKTATSELALEQSALDTLTAELVGKGLKADDPALEGLSAQIRKVSAKQLALKALQRDLANVMKDLTYSQETLFPSASDTVEGEPIIIPTEVYASWLPKVGSLPDNTTAATKAKEAAVFLKLNMPANLAGGTNFDDSGQPEKASRRAGIRYRVAVPATLLACRQYRCGEAPSLAAPEIKAPVASVPVRALQKDTTFYLPFKSEPFSNGGLTATFTESGVLTSAGYDQKRSQGEALMTATGSVVDSILAIGKAQRDAEKSELDQVKAEVDLAKAKKDLAAAEAALDRSPLADQQEKLAAISADTALKQAEVASIQADIALAKAKAELATHNAVD